jgi:hypothetical protein
MLSECLIPPMAGHNLYGGPLVDGKSTELPDVWCRRSKTTGRRK